MRGRGQWTIFIISLKCAVERRRRILKMLEDVPGELEILQAIDGRKGLPKEWISKVDFDAMKTNLGRRMTDAECACALSHLEVYKLIIGRGLPGAVVLEDDTVWSQEATDCLHALMPGELDFVQFDYGSAAIWRFLPGRRVQGTNVRLRRLAKNAPFANAYLLSNRAAQYLLRKSCPVMLPADWPCRLSPLRPMLCVPRVCFQSDKDVEASYLEESRNSARLKKSSFNSHRGKEEIAFVSSRNPEPNLPRILKKFLIERIPKEKRL